MKKVEPEREIGKFFCHAMASLSFIFLQLDWLLKQALKSDWL